jgi:hypothetical protein
MKKNPIFLVIMTALFCVTLVAPSACKGAFVDPELIGTGGYGGGYDYDGDGDDHGNGGGNIPQELVARWGNGNTEYIKIDSDGGGTWAISMACQWSVNGTTLTLHMSEMTGTVTWSVNSGKLTLSNAGGSLAASLATLVSQSPLDKLQ